MIVSYLFLWYILNCITYLKVVALKTCLEMVVAKKLCVPVEGSYSKHDLLIPLY